MHVQKKSYWMLKVKETLGGGLSLKIKRPRDRIFHDLLGPLFSNKNHLEFKAALNDYVLNLTQRGIGFVLHQPRWLE